jgi:ribosomal protein S18 acetylase RimI-like enzyme
MKYSIRKAEMNDIKFVQHVAKVSWNSTYKGIIPDEIQENFLTAAYSEDMMERRIKNSLFLVAVAGEEIIGFANFSPVREEGEVELGAIYLLPDYQGNAIGTALLQEGIHLLEGVRKVFINVEKENEIGKNFYRAKGFQVFSEFDDDFDGHILKTIRMVLHVEE